MMNKDNANIPSAILQLAVQVLRNLLVSTRSEST